MKRYPKLLLMNAKFPQVTPLVCPDASVRAIASSPQSRPGLLDLYKISALVVVLCLVYLNIPSYVHTLTHEGFRTDVLLFRILCHWRAVAIKIQLAELVLDLTIFRLGICADHAQLPLLFALIDGDQSRAGLFDSRILYAVLAVLLGFACSITRSTLTNVSFRSWPRLSRLW